MKQARMDLTGNKISPSQGLSLSLARSPEEVREAQRLRYQVFAREMGAQLDSCASGIDSDRFDPLCHHLIVREERFGQVVGTYRILTPEKGCGQRYSQTEFDLEPLLPDLSRTIEVGRSCVRKDFRQGAVISLLWSGLATFMQVEGYEALLGCASVSLREGGDSIGQIHSFLQATAWPPAHRTVTPLRPYPLPHLLPPATTTPPLPPLLKGYLKLGATVMGNPAYDPDFNTADYLIHLSIDRMNERYRRHFMRLAMAY